MTGPQSSKTGQQLAYRELVDRSRQFGAALVASGIEPGDRVAIWAFNCTEWIVASLGLFQAGAVLVPVNTRFKGAEAADILLRSRARVLVTVTDFLDTDYVAMLRGTGTDAPGSGGDRGGRPGPRDRPGPSRGRTSPPGPPSAERAEVDRRSAAVDPRRLRATSCSPRAPPASRRVWSRPTAAPPRWPPTGWT